MSRTPPKLPPAYYSGYGLIVEHFEDTAPVKRSGKLKRRAKQENANVCYWYGIPFNDVQLSICAQCERAIRIAPGKSNCPRCIRVK